MRVCNSVILVICNRLRWSNWAYCGRGFVPWFRLLCVCICGRRCMISAMQSWLQVAASMPYTAYTVHFFLAKTFTLVFLRTVQPWSKCASNLCVKLWLQIDRFYSLPIPRRRLSKKKEGDFSLWTPGAKFWARAHHELARKPLNSLYSTSTVCQSLIARNLYAPHNKSQSDIPECRDGRYHCGFVWIAFLG